VTAPRKGGADEGSGVKSSGDAPTAEEQAHDDEGSTALEGEELSHSALPDGGDDPRAGDGGAPVTDDQ
jgi:hypothetical protein